MVTEFHHQLNLRVKELVGVKIAPMVLLVQFLDYLWQEVEITSMVCLTAQEFMEHIGAVQP